MTPGRSDPSSGAATGGSDDESADSSRETPTYRRIFRRFVPGVVRRNFAAKFVAALLVVVVLIGLIGVGTYFQIQGSIQDDATASVERTAELQSAAVSDWVGSMRAQTAMVAAPDRVPASTNRTALRSYLDTSLSRSADAIRSIHVVDDGVVVASTISRFENESLSDVPLPWASEGSIVQQVGEDVVVTPTAYQSGGEATLAFAARVAGPRVVVVESHPPSRFTAMDADDVSTHLLTTERAAVFGTTPERRDALTGVGAFVAAEGGATRTVEVDGEVRTYAPVAGTDWIAVSTAQTATLYAVSDTVGRNVVVLVAAALVSLVVVGVVLGRGTVGPLADLRERTREIEAGNLDVDLSSDREDEIGRLYQAFASMRDGLHQQVREAKQARAEAESSRKEMERQNRRLDQFASTLSHDLRNPLAVARGHVELLNTKLDDDEDLREHVEKIDDAHDRIDSIINDVLTLTRKGESVEETERFELEGVAREAWGNIDSKQATLTVAESIAIEGDRSRLLRALENLFRNSLDHGGEDVSVTVGLTEDGFYVQDDGPGIPDEEMGDIFEYGHTTSDDGTGIGLSIVKTIAEAHGWSLWIDGTYEGGARFVFADVFGSEERLFEESAFTWDHAEAETTD